MRDDGWMEASFNQRTAYELKKDAPPVLRYELFVHRGDLDAMRAEEQLRRFAATSAFEITSRPAPYRYALMRRT